MAERILTEEQIQAITENITRNGGQPVSADLKELDDYLKKNPPTTVYLDN